MFKNNLPAFFFTLAILFLFGSLISILLGHMGFALRVFKYIYFTLVVGVLMYILSIRKYEKK